MADLTVGVQNWEMTPELAHVYTSRPGLLVHLITTRANAALKRDFEEE
jgi:hypothetical protein